MWCPYILKVLDWVEETGRWKSRGKNWLGGVLDGGGQEPLALVHLVLLHLAEWCTEGPLRDLKGNTEGWCGLGC